MEQDEFESLLDITREYEEKRHEQLKDLPFHYNVLEGIHLNENRHTRLLMRLLTDHSATKHFISWLHHQRNFSLQEEKINSPEISVERYRIDGLVQEKDKYAIIIENKVHGAEEQEEQLQRYINQCKENGYKLEQIYILYLFARRGNVPSKKSWGNYSPEDFGDRFVVLSYADDIVSWLRDFLQDFKQEEEKAELLRAGIIQYLDYLELQFKRDRYTKMNKHLKQLIKNKLEQDLPKDAPITDYLKHKIWAIERIKSEVEELLGNKRIEIWAKEIDEAYPNAKTFSDVKLESEYPKAGIHLRHKEHGDFVALVEFDPKYHSICIGVSCHDGASEGRQQRLEEWFDANLSNILPNPAVREWYRWVYVEPEKAMIKFKELVETLVPESNPEVEFIPR